MPLHVEVDLAGIPENDVPRHKLETFLGQSFGAYYPSEEGGAPLIGLNISYRVQAAQDDMIRNYETFLSRHAIGSDGAITVPVEALREFINDQFDSSSVGSLTLFRIVILHDDRLPRHRILASHSDELDCTQAVIANVAFLDLSATPCDRNVHSANIDSHVVWHSFNYRHPWPLSFVPEHKVRWLPEPMKDIESHRIARLHAIITSAVKSIAISRIDEADENVVKAFAPRLLLPIYVFHNADAHQGDTQIDSSAVQSRLQKFLPPGHELSVMHVVYHAGEIPEISVAVAESMRVVSKSLVDGSGEEITVDIPHFNTEILWRSIKGKIEKLNAKFAGAAFHEVVSAGYYYMSEMGESNAIEHASLPVVIFADFHSHVTGAPNVLLPLFDDYSALSVVPGEAVLAAYSSAWKYSIFDETPTSSGGSWTVLEHLRIEDVVLQAALEAISSLKAPHLQRASAPERVVDMTWAENNDPLWALAPPIGCNRRAPRPERSTLEWASVRGLILSYVNSNQATAWGHYERFEALIRSLETLGSEDASAVDLAGIWEAEDFGLFNHEDVASLKFTSTVTSIIDSMRQELKVLQELAQQTYDFKNDDVAVVVISLHDVKARVAVSAKALEDYRYRLVDEFTRCYLSTSRRVPDASSLEDSGSTQKRGTKSVVFFVSMLLLFCVGAGVALWLVMRKVTEKAKKIS